MKSSVNYQCLFILIIVGLRLFSETTANWSYMFLSLYAFLGKKQAIQSLLVLWFFTMANPAILPSAFFASVGRYAVMMSVALSIFFHSRILFDRKGLSLLVRATVLLGTFIVAHSCMFSFRPDISILKIIIWLTVMVSLLSAWLGMTSSQKEVTINQAFGVLTLIFLASIPLLLHPVGYLRNNSGFQGILNHPQVFGSTMALLGAWTVGQIFTSDLPSWKTVLLTGGCFIMIFLSESRTAGLALASAIFTVVIIVWLVSNKKLSNVVPGLWSRKIWGVLMFLLVFGLLMAPRISDNLKDYISKSNRSGEVENIVEVYERSRGTLIYRMWKNIQDYPFAGIGFGIASERYDMRVKRDPWLNFPISAPIEKGVMPLAMLEELGIIGFFFVVIWFGILLRWSIAGGITSLLVFGTAFFLNMGESIFFSPGGMGLLVMILVGWTVSIGKNAKNV